MTQNIRLYSFTPTPYKAVVEKLKSNPKDQCTLIKIIHSQGFEVRLEWCRATFKTIVDLSYT